MARNSWRVLIADDEPAARRGVRQLLAPYPRYTVVGECRDGREVLAALDSLGPDLLFLDVQMPEIGGFDVIRRRGVERMPVVVFLTAYDQFAIRAFDAEALDYLVKPVSEARFAATIKRVEKRLSAGDGGEARRDQSIVVTTSRGVVVLSLCEIDWIEAADYYARLWVGAKSYLLRESLLHLERRIAASGFVRAHRQALIRVDGVRALATNASGDMTAVLASGAKVPVSRRRRAAVSAAVRKRSLGGAALTSAPPR
jgi:two-component system, LytTR family, response regulator